MVLNSRGDFVGRKKKFELELYKCEYNGCESLAEVYLKSVNMHYCKKHFKIVVETLLRSGGNVGI